jgi:hypothetical protein
LRFQVRELGARQLEREIVGKPFPIALGLFVESLGGDTVNASQITIQYNLLTSDEEDGSLDPISWYPDAYFFL